MSAAEALAFPGAHCGGNGWIIEPAAQHTGDVPRLLTVAKNRAMTASVGREAEQRFRKPSISLANRDVFGVRSSPAILADVHIEQTLFGSRLIWLVSTSLRVPKTRQRVMSRRLLRRGREILHQRRHLGAHEVSQRRGGGVRFL